MTHRCLQENLLPNDVRVQRSLCPRTRHLLTTCFHVECLNNLGTGSIDMLEPSPFTFNLSLFNHWNGLAEYVMINGKLCLDWSSYCPLNDLTFVLLDDADWAEVPKWNAEFADSYWEAAEAEDVGAMLVHFTDSVSEGGGEFLLVSHSKGIKGQVNADG